MESVNTGLAADEVLMFTEIAKVLEKYSAKEKYGLFNIHNHFELAQDEVLHETNDPTKRHQIQKAMKFAELPESSRPTQWVPSADGNHKVNLWCCD